MGNLKETHNVFLGFFFPWEKPFGNHKMCLLMGFSRGNTTRRQPCLWILWPFFCRACAITCPIIAGPEVAMRDTGEKSSA